MGFVKLNDNLKNWAWINDPKTVYIYVRLLLGAAWQDTDVGNVHLRRGEIAISQRDFATQCLVTRQELRTALNRLMSTQKISQRVERKISIITLCEYDCDALTTAQNLTKQQPNNNPIVAQCQPNVNPPTLLNTKEQNIKSSETHTPAARPPAVSDESFDKFWAAYPKKTAKQDAKKAWAKLKPDEELLNKIITSLERQKKTEQWTSDSGQYIPYPATWLNGRRWEDEVEPPKSTNNSGDGWNNKPLTDEERQKMIDDYFG